MFSEFNIIPVNDEEDHIPFTQCDCGPSWKVIRNRNYLIHHSFDNREVWMAAELLLGITCYEHRMFIDGPYLPGRPHNHKAPPEPLYEYDHKKIDPR